MSWDGRHHAITGIQINGAKLVAFMPFVSTFADDFDDPAEVARYLIGFLTEVEKDEGLRVPRLQVAPGVRQAIRDGDLTGITLANLAACGAAFSVRLVGDNQYGVIYDTRLARGIPHFFDLMARLLWDLRQDTRSEHGVPFAVAFASARNIDADQYLGDVPTRVAGAQADPGAMVVTSAPEVGGTGGKATASAAGGGASSGKAAGGSSGSGTAAPSGFRSGLDHPTPMQADEGLFEGQLMAMVRSLPMDAAIEGTHVKDRAARIEDVKVGDPLVLVADWENPWFDPVAIEVFDAHGGTLGYLTHDTTLCDFSTDTGYRGLACLLPHVRAKVASVTPLSKRRKNAKYALLDVRVDVDAAARDELDGGFGGQVLEEAKAILRRPKAERAVASIAPAGGVGRPVLSTLVERAAATGGPAAPVRLPRVQEGTATAAAAGEEADGQAASDAPAAGEPAEARSLAPVLVPEDQRRAIQGLAWVVNVPQRLVNALSRVAEQRRLDELRAEESVLPENWTLASGQRAVAPEFSLAVPDGWKAFGARDRGDRALRLYPATTTWDDIDDLGEYALDGIFYCPMDVRQDDDAKREMGERGIPEFARARVVTAWTTRANPRNGNFEDARVVRGRGCDVLVLRDASVGSSRHGSLEGFEYKLIPCMARSFAYLRLWFPNQTTDRPTATMEKVCELAATVELAEPFECDVLTNLEMCQGMEVDAEFFAKAATDLLETLGGAERVELNAFEEGHAWWDDGASVPDWRLAYRTGALHYATELYDAYEAQEGLGVAADELEKMLAAVGEFLQWYWFVGDADHDDVGSMERLGALRANDLETLREPAALEELLARIERAHPGFGARYDPRAVLSRLVLAQKAAEQAYEEVTKKADELYRRVEALNGPVERASAQVRRLYAAKAAVPKEATAPLQAEIGRLEGELDGLGLFSRGRKRELEAQIDERRAELGRVRERESKAAQERHDAELAKAQEELEPLAKERNAALLEARAALSEYVGDRKAGDTVLLGRYPQEPGGKDATPIEWTVLEAKDDSALLVSTHVLDWKELHARSVEVDYTNSSLYAWLRLEFLAAAFTAHERSLLSIDPLILGVPDLERLMPTDESRRATMTDYAADKRWLDFEHDGLYAQYWTSTPNPDGDDKYESKFFYVDHDGSTGGRYDSFGVYASLGFRPAIRVRLSI